MYDLLPEVQCPVLYIFGGKSEFSTSEDIQQKRIRTGKGDAAVIVIKEAGHLVPLEEVNESGIT